MKETIDVDFRRTPLEEAVLQIAEEIQVDIKLDEAALEQAGYTRNMPQTFRLTAAPATEALNRILGQYEGMVLVVDEPSEVAKVTTERAALAKGWKPFRLVQ